MDRPRFRLHYPNMASIPVYALYGENDGQLGQDWLHWETIQSRSRLHGYEIAPHRHEQFFQLLLVTGGSARAVLDGAVHDLVPPVAAIVPALTVHGYSFSSDVDGIVLTLLEREVAGQGLSFAEAAVLPVAPSLRGDLDRLIAEADRPGPAHDQAMRALITLLLVALHRARHEPAIDTAPANRARLYARDFRALVDQRFRQTRRIDDYAGALGISPTHLNRVSRQILGHSALAVVERRVALELRRHLRFSELTVKQIASELGYDDPAYFSRFARRVLGMPPSAYRDQAKKA